MRGKTIRKLAITAACCVGLGSSTTTLAKGGGMGRGGGHFGSHGFGTGHSSFGHTKIGKSQMGSNSSFFGHTKSKTKHSRSATAKKKKNSDAKKHIARGNSAFGHRQGDPATRTRGSQNSAFGQAHAAANHADDSVIGTAAGGDNQTGPGNSDFGHRQGNPETRTTGSQNSAFGQAHANQAKGAPAPTP